MPELKLIQVWALHLTQQKITLQRNHGAPFVYQIKGYLTTYGKTLSGLKYKSKLRPEGSLKPTLMDQGTLTRKEDTIFLRKLLLQCQ